MSSDDIKRAYSKLPLSKKLGRVKRKTSQVEPKDHVLSFGMHRGKKLGEVPIDYLQWVVSNVVNRTDDVAVVKRFLNVSEKKPVSIAELTGLKRNPPAPPAPAKRASENEGISFIEDCSRLVSAFYKKAAQIDVLKLNTVNQIKYRYWMDISRRMQAVIDQDRGKGSVQALVSLRALRASLTMPSERDRCKSPSWAKW